MNGDWLIGDMVMSRGALGEKSDVLAERDISPRNGLDARPLRVVNIRQIVDRREGASEEIGEFTNLNQSTPGLYVFLSGSGSGTKKVAKVNSFPASMLPKLLTPSFRASETTVRIEPDRSAISSGDRRRTF